MYSTPATSSPFLDRSPSLSSDSGSSSAGTLPPVTPALPSTDTFASTTSSNAGLSEFGTPLKSTLSRGRGTPGAAAGGKTSPWSAGHRTGGGSVSFDGARAMFANLEAQNGRVSPVPPSPATNTSSASPWARPGSPVRSTSPFKENNGRASPVPSNGSVVFPRSSSPTHSSAADTPTRLSTSPTRFGSPTRASRPPLPTIPSDRPMPSSPPRPAHGSYSPNPNFGFSSPSLSHSPSSTPAHRERERVLSSAIFSSRDRPSSPAIGSSPDLAALSSTLPGLDRSVVGSVRSAVGRAGSHRRAMTLPQNLVMGRDGLPVPAAARAEKIEEEVEGKMQGLAIEEDVPGLPGRARLSRPASSASPFAPSAVFQSSHGLSSAAEGGASGSVRGPPARSMTTLLPSQAAKMMDRQREDLVAYEYLCHLAEARQWLASNISTLPDPNQPLWGESINEFEQSLRNGYALAHLARSLGTTEGCKGGIYNDPVRHFRHTVNINIFFSLVGEVGLPEIFRFETVDLYDAKNLPKVIYCLHALSHLMARRGLTSKMEDLVGKVDFTDAEVGAAQKGLNDAGVRMPNFRGIAKAMDKHEAPPETPEQRQERLLAVALPGTISFQATARGALARRRFAAMVQQQRALERQRARERQEEERRRAAEEAAEAERQRRAEEERLRREAEEAERRRIAEEEERRRQAAEDARLAAEEEERQYQAAVQEAARTLVGFQAVARGVLQRRRFYAPIEQLARHEPAVTGFQAAARAALVRRQLERKKATLVDSSSAIISFQAACRALLARRRLIDRIRELRSADAFIVGVQAHIRGALARQSFATKARDLRKTEVVRSIGGLQSLARAALARRRVHTQRQELGFVEPDVVGIQAQTRGWLAREKFLAWRENLCRNEPTLVYLQAMLRGALARKRYWDLHRHFHENLSKVVRLQAAIRSRRQGSQYRQLRMGTNVPVTTIKNFMRLLDDSEFDYRGELQVESLRKELMSAIKETGELEDDVKDLDTKIALLVKNKITHEVARAQRAGAGGLAPLKRSSLLSAANDPFAGGTLDRQTQRKLDLYQALFWMLQTRPQYLARLFANATRLGMSDKVKKAIEATAWAMFSFGTGSREEYLFLKLLQQSVKEELNHVPSMDVFVRTQFTFIRLLSTYGRNASHRPYFNLVIGPRVNAVLQRPNLDLGTDPVAIYRNEIAQEEMRTGYPSQRPKDVTFKQAVSDRATNKIFISHLIALRGEASAMLDSLTLTTRSMPYGVRYLCREMFRALRHRYADQPDTEAIRIVGHIVWYRYLQPALLSPEVYALANQVPPRERHNLAEIGKILNQVSVGRLFGSDAEFLVPMNDFVRACSAQYAEWIKEVIMVEDAETHFHTDNYADAAASSRPTIYISPNDIYSIHSVLNEHLDIVAPEEEDPVRGILVELGGAPSGGASAELARARAENVYLTLATRITPDEDPEAESKHLFNQAKRRVLAILKVHHGNDLEAVLAQQVTAEDEEAWARIVEEEEMEERRRAHEQRRPVVPQLDDIRNMSFHQLKMATLSDIVQLRKMGSVSRSDKYQAILNAIARDIRGKHQRRVQRQNELQTMHATLKSLQEKKRYLDDQIKSYHVYIDESMKGIQKKSKKRMVLPWSLQASHQRQLEREGKAYKFGSYKYTAQKLYERGILLSIDAFSPRQFDKVTLAVSSDEIGVFVVEASFMGKTVTSVELKLEDLLDMQFAGKQTITIGDVAKCSLNLLVGLINRKYTAQKLYERGILLSIDAFSPRQFDKVTLAVSSDEIGVFVVEASFMGKTVTSVELKLEDLLDMQFAGKQTITIGDVAKCSLNLLVGLINRKFYQ
ncbi:hypothetical protein JCM10207_006185 [Rhodosporidiobolus poonsookiae]